VSCNRGERSRCVHKRNPWKQDRFVLAIHNTNSNILQGRDLLNHSRCLQTCGTLCRLSWYSVSLRQPTLTKETKEARGDEGCRWIAKGFLITLLQLHTLVHLLLLIVPSTHPLLLSHLFKMLCTGISLYAGIYALSISWKICCDALVLRHER
jgi:hypothetical protein